MTRQGRLSRILLISGFAALNFGLDRITKALASVFLTDKGIVRVLGDVFVLVYAENEGAFLSFGSGFSPILKIVVFIVLPLCAVVFSVIYIQKSIEKALFPCMALAAVFGGGIGNILDRVMNDFRVVDFLHFSFGPLRTGILNVADLSITFGAICFAAYELIDDRKKKTA